LLTVVCTQPSQVARSWRAAQMANNHNASFDCRFCFLVHFPFGHCDKTCELTIAVGSLLASPLKIFGRRPPCLWPRSFSGRHPKPLYEREVVKGLSARLRSRVVSFCLAPLQSPYPFVPTRNISTPSRAGPVKDGRRAVRATRAEFPGHSLTGLSTMAGSGASGSLSPPAELVL